MRVRDKSASSDRVVVVGAANTPDQPGCQMSRYLADLAGRVAELCERIQVARERMRARAGH